MGVVWKDDFPPLLPMGFHPMTLAQLRALCVGSFPNSITRTSVMDGLEAVILQLNKSGIPMEVWVDGSFTTQKLNPEDSDIVIRLSGPDYDGASMPAKAPIVWAVQNDLKPSHKCDSYAFPEYPEGHKLYGQGQWRRAYWLNKFGYDRQEQPKGLAVIKLPVLSP